MGRTRHEICCPHCQSARVGINTTRTTSTAPTGRDGRTLLKRQRCVCRACGLVWWRRLLVVEELVEEVAVTAYANAGGGDLKVAMQGFLEWASGFVNKTGVFGPPPSDCSAVADCHVPLPGRFALALGLHADASYADAWQKFYVKRSPPMPEQRPIGIDPTDLADVGQDERPQKRAASPRMTEKLSNHRARKH